MDGAEPQFQQGNKCEWAAIMHRGRQIKSEWASLCLKAQMLPEQDDDPTSKRWLTAEAEMGNDVARAAGRIVTYCNGCDADGVYTNSDGCPPETRQRVKEWLRTVGPMRYMGPPLDK